MKGIVYNGTTTELVDGLTLRAPGPREVVVQVAAAGLCHSDISYMSGMYPVPSPGVCGHEAAGVVAEVGNAVTHVQPGDHVIIATLAACGFCQYCMDGRPTACRATLGNWSQPFTLNGDPIYNFAATSAFAEKTLVRDVQCVKIPKDVPLTSAALVGCGVVTGMGQFSIAPMSSVDSRHLCSVSVALVSTSFRPSRFKAQPPSSRLTLFPKKKLSLVSSAQLIS